MHTLSPHMHYVQYVMRVHSDHLRAHLLDAVRRCRQGVLLVRLHSRQHTVLAPQHGGAAAGAGRLSTYAGADCMCMYGRQGTLYLHAAQVAHCEAVRCTHLSSPVVVAVRTHMSA